MGPFDHKGRSILGDADVSMLALSLSRRRNHKEAKDLSQDEQDIRDVLETQVGMGWVLMPQGVLESFINELRKALSGGQTK